MPCELCAFKIKTRLYNEDDMCIVVDCDTCHVPMIVLKRHAQVPLAKEERHMRDVVQALGFKIARKRPKKIKDHVHWHLEAT